MHWIDPEHLPVIPGRVTRLLLSPRGEVDGFLLGDGLEVLMPPHVGAAVAAALTGSHDVTVGIRGVKLRAGNVVAAVAVDLPDGRRFADNGPDHPPSDQPSPNHRPPPQPAVERTPATTTGRIERLLHGGKGELRGVLLHGGEQVRFAAAETEPLAKGIHIGAPFAAAGERVMTTAGSVLVARAIGASADELRDLQPAKEKPGKLKPSPKPGPKADHQRDADAGRHAG
ncbi:hypothetical protein [Nitrospirillum pindoramense]|uniref:Uncharacterized protein n=1 Tax=Nitrospirillum amazonense TaxID=28077 RepID=A0A560GYH7_9PROT|nr:hypothetical protein [Nitrospirillum amazonense]TWB39086.1 hypothetical protein FBZ90_11181 [Nitrospirillum amazonense]